MTHSARPNPQGKANLPLLQMLEQSQPAPTAPVLSAEQGVRAYFVSTLVLSAVFQFEPRRGHSYYLYYKAPDWRLSMIEPQHDPRGRLGHFFARCTLAEDALWHLHVDTRSRPHQEVVKALAQHHQQLADFLETHTKLEEQLPWYIAELPFHRRVAARAMALSLRPRLADSGLQLPQTSEADVLGLAFKAP